MRAYHSGMAREGENLLVVLGATASGKTRLGARLAHALGGEVVSADSRQVYRGLKLGAGKDLDEYVVDGVPVPYHLIDIVDLDAEFSVFAYQRCFYKVFESIRCRGCLSVVVGGTGLYLEAVLAPYRMVEAPPNPELRAELDQLPQEALVARLRTLKPRLHNTTDLTDRDRLVRAVEIATYSQTHEPKPAPDMRPLVLGTHWERSALRRRIHGRLQQRLDAGMIDEVAGLHARGVSWERLERLGLEYRFIAQYLEGKMRDKTGLFEMLFTAICQFAKRQETWFRRMERNGTVIHWVDEADFDAAWRIVREHLTVT